MSSDSEDDDDEYDEHVDKHTAFQQENTTVGDNQPNGIKVFSDQASQSNLSNLSEEETDSGGNKQRSNLRVTTYRYYNIVK